MSEQNPKLQALYPFLHGGRKDSDRENAALLESVRQKARHSVDTKQEFFVENAQQVVDAARAIADVYRRDGRLFAMGNGGSSCDASHIAVEFLHPITAGRPALPAVNLVADTAMMTAVGNDVGFKHIFVRQIIALARKGDGLIGISTSGNSEDLLLAFAKAKELGLTTIGLSGMDGARWLRVLTSIVASPCAPTVSTAFRRPRWPSTIFSGIWCIPYSPIKGVVFRRRCNHEIHR